VASAARGRRRGKLQSTLRLLWAMEGVEYMRAHAGICYLYHDDGLGLSVSPAVQTWRLRGARPPLTLHSSALPLFHSPVVVQGRGRLRRSVARGEWGACRQLRAARLASPLRCIFGVQRSAAGSHIRACQALPPVPGGDAAPVAHGPAAGVWRSALLHSPSPRRRHASTPEVYRGSYSGLGGRGVDPVHESNFEQI
jgi:hypothetical protein